MKSIANYWKYVPISKLRNILPCSFTIFQVSLWLTSHSDQSSVMDKGKGGSLPPFFSFPLSSSRSRSLFSTPKATYDTKRKGAYFSLFSMLNRPWKMCCTTIEIHFELFKQMPFLDVREYWMFKSPPPWDPPWFPAVEINQVIEVMR